MSLLTKKSRRDPVSQEPPEATSWSWVGMAQRVHKLTRVVIILVAPFHTNMVFQF